MKIKSEKNKKINKQNIINQMSSDQSGHTFDQ